MSIIKKQYKVLLDSANFFCKPNLTLVSQFEKFVKKNNYTITKNIADADFLILNTCFFDEKREKVSYEIFRDIFKKKKESAKVISLGCINVINDQLLKTQFPDLYIVKDFSKIDELLETDIKYEINKNAYFDKTVFRYIVEKVPQPFFNNSALMGAKFLARLAKNSKSSRVTSLHLPQIVEEMEHSERSNKIHVLIGRGCVGNCSYCIIKKAQGSPKSRRIEDIIEDIKAIYTKDKTLSLVADDCASFGIDTGETLFGLVDRIQEEFPELPIDITYINCLFLERYSEQYIEMFKKVKINSVQMSIQSGSDKIIKLMNRKYKIDNIVKFIDKIKEISPETMIWTHFIAGFPGETWKDFYRTLKVSNNFHYFHIHTYSPREGTKSAEWKNNNPPFIRELRTKTAYAWLALRINYKVLFSFINRINSFYAYFCLISCLF